MEDADIAEPEQTREHPDHGWVDAAMLEPGERLLWQGRPDASIRLIRRNWSLVPMALLIVGIGGAAFVHGIVEGRAPWFVIMFGTILAFGVAMVPLSVWSDTRRRRNTLYALTSRRILICVFGMVHSFGPKEWTVMRTHITRDGLCTLVFREEKIARQTVEIGFDLIPDGDIVRDMMQRIAGNLA